MAKYFSALGLLALFSSCAHAQPYVLPSGTVVGRISTTNDAGELLFPNNANIRCIAANYATCKPLIIKNNAINGANLAAALTITGATATDGRIILNPGNVAAAASVVINAIRASEPALKIKDSTTGGTAQGLDFEDSGGSSYLKIDTNGGSPEFLTAAPLRFISSSISNPVVSITNFLGGPELKIGSYSGVASLTTGIFGVVSGTSTNCVLVNASSTPCMTNPMTTAGDIIYGGGGGAPTRLGIGTIGACLVAAGTPFWQFPCVSDPAWTAYTPTASVTAGSISTSSVSGAYIQTGKTVRVRVNWNGTVSAGQPIVFSVPVNPKSSPTVQSVSALAYDSGTNYGASGFVFGGVNLFAVQPLSGGTFPVSFNFSTVIEGVYEAN